jgi:hypothetical protein
MEIKGLIKYIIVIAIILVVVFLSQQAYSRGVGGNLISAAADQVGAYLSKGSGWVMSNIYPKISGEVQKRGDIIKTEVNQEKQKVAEDLGKKIQNYISGVANSLTGQANNCPSQPSQTTVGQ